MKDWGNFLHQILEEDYEDSTLITTFFLCGGSAASRGGSWWPPVVMGGGEEGVRVWVGVWRGGEGEIVFFTLKNVFIIYRSRLASLSR